MFFIYKFSSLEFDEQVFPPSLFFGSGFSPPVGRGSGRSREWHGNREWRGGSGNRGDLELCGFCGGTGIYSGSGGRGSFGGCGGYGSELENLQEEDGEQNKTLPKLSPASQNMILDNPSVECFL